MASRHRAATGFSLIELMVALAIGTFLMLGLVEVFAASRAAYALSEGLSRTQENARFAMDYLQRDLRMAGHMGCVNDLAHSDPGDVDDEKEGRSSVYSSIFTGGTAATLAFDAQIVGYEATGSAPGNARNPAPVAGWAGSGVGGAALPAAISGLVPAPIAGSDILVLRFFGPESAPVVANLTAVPATIQLTPANLARLTTGANQPGLFALAGCGNAIAFQATSLNAATGAITVNANGINQQTLAAVSDNTPNMDTGALLYRAEMVVYYVGVGVSGEPALIRARFNAQPGATGITADTDELVEGIESLQLLYGQGPDPDNPVVGDLTQYNVASAMDGGNARDAARLTRAVQVGLLARSPTPSTARGVPRPELRPTVVGVRMDAPDDGRYRAAYHSTVALRNHVTVRH